MVFSRQNSAALLRLPVQATVKRMSSVLPCTEPTSFLPHQPSPTIAARNISPAPLPFTQTSLFSAHRAPRSTILRSVRVVRDVNIGETFAAGDEPKQTAQQSGG